MKGTGILFENAGFAAQTGAVRRILGGVGKLHDKYGILIQQLIDREIHPLERLTLVEHLHSCRKCRRELNQLKLLDWELNHQPDIELPPELAACRWAVLNSHFAVREPPQRKSSLSSDLWQMQLQTISYATKFIGLNPVNRTLNQAFRRSFSLLGKMAVTSLKKKNPLLARFIPGRT